MPNLENLDFSEFHEPKHPGFIDSLMAKYGFPVIILLVGLILLGLGVFLNKSGMLWSDSEIEVLSSESVPEGVEPISEIVVELGGAVQKPDVYKIAANSRISDLLVMGGGLSADADRVWVEKYINKAAVLTDGQKIYIPRQDEQLNAKSANFSSTENTNSGSVSGTSTSTSGLININTASLAELDKLPGIGPVFGQNIIEQRPYSSVEELLTKKVLRSDVYEKIKDKVIVY